MRNFVLLLISQTASLLGLSMLGFALGVWIYQHSGSLTELGFISLAASLPMALLSPFAGAIIDRGRHKRLLIIVQMTILLCIGLLWLIAHNDNFNVNFVILTVALGAAVSAFVFPALAVSIPLMLDKEQLSRASGMISMALALVQLLAPATAGALLAAATINGVFVCASLMVIGGFVLLLPVKFPDIGSKHAHENQTKTPVWRSVHEGWIYLKSHPLILLLIVFYTAMGFNMQAINLLIAPVVLGFSNEQSLGLIASAGGVGMIVGSAVMIAWRGARNKMNAILGAATVMCIAYILTPLWQSAGTVAAFTAIVMFCFPVISASSQWIFQHWIEHGMQGRVFGLRNLALGLTRPAAVFCTAPLVDHWLTGAMQTHGALSQSLGPIYGTGQGRGAAVLISLLGIVGLLIVAIAWIGPLRKLGEGGTDTTDN